MNRLFPASRLRLSCALFLAAGVAACDGTARSLPDADPEGSATGGKKTAELVVRLDAPAGGLPSASLVAFKAKVVGIDPEQVAGAVDPLMVAGPDGKCALRQVDETIRLLHDSRGAVELEGLSRFAVELNATASLRPVPRVYPDLASVVTGVVAEAGPEDLAELPPSLTLKSEAGGDVVLQVPALPQITGADGAVVRAGQKFSRHADLRLTVAGTKGSYVELRPFGATTWAACPVGVEGRVTVPAELLNRLVGTATSAPVSLDVVWRNRQIVQIGGEPARLSLETRASALVEITQ